MSLTKFNESVNNVGSLNDKPALTSAQLKAVFDKAGNDIKTYINSTLTEEIDTVISQQRTQLVGMINDAKSELNTTIIQKLQLSHPVGSTYITQTDTNPSTILGFGTWVRIKGKVCIGLDEDDTDGYFDEIGKTGGEKKHTQTIDELCKHSHSFSNNVWVQNEGYGNINAGTSSSANRANISGATTSQVGGGEPFNVVQPYEVVGYMWKRTN